MSETQNRRTRLGSGVVAISSLLLFAFGLFAIEGRALASTLFGDVFFAIAFSIIPFVIGCPILIGIGFLIRSIAERFLHRRIAGRKYMPWLIPAVIGLGCVAGSFLQNRSSRKLFHDFLNIDSPSSVSNFQYWWVTLPGDALYVFSFEIDPTEFDKLLANRQFIEDSDPENIGQALKIMVRPGQFGMNIQLPHATLIKMYKSSTEGPPGVPHTINVFTTEDRRQVVICGDN
jgi:hypothetical protein